MNEMKKWIFAGLFFLFVLVIVVIVSNPRQPSKSKELAEDYFEISDIGFFGTYNNETGELKVKRYWFTIKAVGGNATETYITQVEGILEDQEGVKELGTIYQGKSERVQINPKLPLVYSNPPYKFTFRISCHEAEGKLKGHFHPE